MTRLPFKGMMAPVFAPFKADGSLNLDVVKPYAAHLKKGGVTGVWVNGSVGEGMSLTVPERKALAEAWLACKSDVPTIIVQCGAVCMNEALDLARHAEAHGASGVAVIPPLYDRPGDADELVDYMVEIAKACPKTPLFYYHIPMKTSVDISMSEFLSRGVRRVPTLSGIKFTDMDVSGEGRKCLKVDGGSLTIFSGFDKTLQEALSVGFSAAVNGCFSFIPQLGARVFSLMAAGRLTEAQQAQKELNECLDVVFSPSGGSITSCMKTACTLLSGLPLGPPRLPIKPLTEDATRGLKTDLESRGCKTY